MTDNKTIFNNLIPASTFEICVIDKADKKTIRSLYPKRADGAYYIDKFKRYIEDKFNLNLIEYCEKYLNLKWPLCPIKNKKVGYRISGKGVEVSRFCKGAINKEHAPKFKLACEKMSKARMGKNNPMFGKKPWNKGKKYESPSMKGRKLSQEHIEKLKAARARSPVKARHTQKHSKKTREILKIRQAEKWKKGVFNRKTSIEIKVEDFLKELGLLKDFCFQEQVKYFTLDFGDKKRKIGIECQGTFFHTDPRVYPNGPITAIQKRNAGRDKSKRIFFEKEGWLIIELWETEINNGEFKEILKSKLLELKVLEK